MPDGTVVAAFGGHSEFDRLARPLLERCVFPPAGSDVTCGVSGGADSLALLTLAAAAGCVVHVVHVDHGLRSGSGNEAEIVANAAERFGASFRSTQAALDDGPDLEARARAARKELIGVDALTGHTADDQAETLLINLLRGAGAFGLAGMRAGGIHPILAIRRSETSGLCRDLGLVVVEDPTNDDPRFIRNRVRHEVLPLLDAVSGRDVIPLLNRTSAQLRELTDHVADVASDIDPTDTGVLAAAPRVLAVASLREWLRDEHGHPPSSAEMQRVMDVVLHHRVGCELSGQRRLRRTEGRLRIESSGP